MEVLAMVMILTSNVMDHNQIRTFESQAIPMVTSWYGEELQGHLMANGKPFRAEDPTTVAHKELPLGTRLEISNPNNDCKITATVRDRGPYVAGRNLDLSRAGAEKLGVKKEGVVTLLVKVLTK